MTIKHRDGAHSSKQRIGIPKTDIPVFFTQGMITPEMVKIQEPSHGRDASAVLHAVARWVSGCRIERTRVLVDDEPVDLPEDA